MPRPKRNAVVADLDSATAATQPAKKGRPTSSKQVVETAAASRPKRASAGVNEAPKANAIKSAPNGETTAKKAKSAKTSKSAKAAKSAKPTVSAKSVKSAKSTKPSKTAGKASKASKAETNGRRTSVVSVEIEKKEGTEAQHDQDGEEEEGDLAYWLMKAEPESRIEKGKDVKFSIDDLKAATEPEGWDGKLV